MREISVLLEGRQIGVMIRRSQVRAMAAAQPFLHVKRHCVGLVRLVLGAAHEIDDEQDDQDQNDDPWDHNRGTDHGACSPSSQMTERRP
jgi:hypothetical protein